MSDDRDNASQLSRLAYWLFGCGAKVAEGYQREAYHHKAYCIYAVRLHGHVVDTLMVSTTTLTPVELSQ